MSIILKSGSGIICLLQAIQLFGQPDQQQVSASETDAVYGFYEYLPESYNEESKNFPLVIYLHGRGERGNGGSDLKEIKKNGPHKMIEEGAEFPAVILSPQSKSWWNIDSLDLFVEWAFENYRIDTTRFYLTGISMGGGGTWLYAKEFPEKLAAIVPICGDAKATGAENLVDIPVWAFHNKGDHIVEVELTYSWINSIKEAGGDPLVTIYEQSGHDAWTETYNNESMWEWMFGQKPEVEPEPLQVSISEESFKVFPNPFSSQLSFRFPEPLVSARLFSLDGKLITEWTTFQQEGEEISLKVTSDILPGVYLLELNSARRYEQLKVIKK